MFFDAAADGEPIEISKLIKGGIDVNVRDSRGCPTQRTALMHAAANGHLDVVDILIQAGATINAIDKGFPIDCPGGNTALILAIQNGHVAIAHRLIDAGASLKTKGGGTSVINSASFLGDAGLLDRLLKSGVDPMQRDGSRFIPLACAAQNGKADAIRLLIARGADPNSMSPIGEPVLNTAVATGHLEACKALIDNGANPNLTGNNGTTPLMRSCLHARMEIVEYLLSLKVDVNRVDELGRTAVDIIQKLQRPPDFAPEIIERRIKMGDNLGPPPERLKAIAALLRKAGAKVNLDE